MVGIYWFWSDFVSVRQTKPEKEAPKKNHIPFICDLRASAGCERMERTFNMPRLMAQIKGDMIFF